MEPTYKGLKRRVNRRAAVAQLATVERISSNRGYWRLEPTYKGLKLFQISALPSGKCTFGAYL